MMKFLRAVFAAVFGGGRQDADAADWHGTSEGGEEPAAWRLVDEVRWQLHLQWKMVKVLLEIAGFAGAVLLAVYLPFGGSWQEIAEKASCVAAVCRTLVVLKNILKQVQVRVGGELLVGGQ